jgi:pyruvate formate lyase activating enzyme
MHPAMWWERYFDDVRCLLCPHQCIISPAQSGRCRLRVNIAGDLYTRNFGQTISSQLDPMRKKPLYHYFPDENILSLGANSCNLHCTFCQNYASSLYDAQTMTIDPSELLQTCIDRDIRHVAFTYTEPFTWFEFIYESALLLTKQNISVVLVTNGYVNPKPLETILPFISAMNIDLKSFSHDFYVKNCEGSLEPVIDTIRYCVGKTHVEVTLLLITGLNDDPHELDRYFRFISQLNPEIPLHISKYFPRYKSQIPATDTKKIYATVDHAKKYLRYVYAGNV